MKKYKLIADPIKKGYIIGIVQGSIYLEESLFKSNDSRPPCSIKDMVKYYPKDWEEVTEKLVGDEK